MTNLQSTAMIAAALASVLGCYTVALHAAAERAAIGAAQAQIARDTSDIRLLRAELRTRSRLPELQRWNEQVLVLAPPRAEQLMANPVMLASYAAPTSPPAAPVATVAAVVRDAAVASPIMRRASFAPRVARDLGADAALAAGVAAPAGAAATMQVGYQKIALR
jgi:hypothetical protein